MHESSPTSNPVGFAPPPSSPLRSIQLPLPPKIDPTVSLMTVEDKPDVTYEDVGGAKDAMEKLREVLETPLLHPERFVALGIEPPKGVLLYGPVRLPIDFEKWTMVTLCLSNCFILTFTTCDR